MKNDTIELFDLNDRLCGTVEVPPGSETAPPRLVVWRGRRFQEGWSEDSFYERNQAGEVPK